MRARHVALAVVVSALWGCNFIAARLALGHMPPLLLAAVRFALAAVPAVALPRPCVPWPRMVAIAATLFIGQFALLFCGMRAGMPPGLASVVTQVQAVITMLLAFVTLHEVPRLRQVLGLVVAAIGLACIGVTAGSGGVTLAGLLLTLAAAASWGAGNVLLRGAGPVDMLPMIVWLSVIPPLPLLILSCFFEHPAVVLSVSGQDAWVAAVAVLYIAFAATLCGYAIWGHLLARYPASAVAPFALLVPVFGMLAARFMVGERFDGIRLAGIALMALGLAAANLPLGGLPLWRRRLSS